jgi:hypothetical protein
MFKIALGQYEQSNDLGVFGAAIDSYSKYSDVLVGYKTTKFLVGLCGEIKSYTSKLRQLSVQKLDELLSSESTLDTDVAINCGQTCLEYLKAIG